MSLSDIVLLIKKILIGIIITLVPFLILFGGLWFTQTFFTKDKSEQPLQHQRIDP